MQIMNFIQENARQIVIFVNIFSFFFVLVYALWPKFRKGNGDLPGAPFDLKTHRFGMAYVTARHPKPFYPVQFDYSGGYGGVVHAVGVETIRHIEPQWLRDLRRAPSYDLCRKDAQNAILARLLNGLAAEVHGMAFKWGRDDELSMAYAAKTIAALIEDKADEVQERGEVPLPRVPRAAVALNPGMDNA